MLNKYSLINKAVSTWIDHSINYLGTKYGKGTGTYWDEVICNSDIEVNVKFAVEGEGRGDF